jgi:hypothetical protein
MRVSELDKSIAFDAAFLGMKPLRLAPRFASSIAAAAGRRDRAPP